jgi:hypothetical protein
VFRKLDPSHIEFESVTGRRRGTIGFPSDRTAEPFSPLFESFFVLGLVRRTNAFRRRPRQTPFLGVGRHNRAVRRPQTERRRVCPSGRRSVISVTDVASNIDSISVSDRHDRSFNKSHRPIFDGIHHRSLVIRHSSFISHLSLNPPHDKIRR